MDRVSVLAALTWDPQIRGAAIVLAGASVLIGSVFLLLSTNLGARMGFLVTVAGLSGWIGVMASVWMVFGIGLKGPEKQWSVKEVLTGEVAASTVAAVGGFPEGWEPLKPGDAELADAQAAADHVLAPSAAPAKEGGNAGIGPKPQLTFDPPFKKTDDYVLLDGYRKGGQTYFFHIRHRPHYALVRVKPSFFKKPPPGLKAQLNLTAPATSVVMIRDLGALRLPPFLLMFSAFTIFGVTTYTLHQRDKEIMRQRAKAAVT